MNRSAEVEAESHQIPVTDGDTLHCRRFRLSGDVPGPVVLMLHGAIENGRMFYSRSGKGLAPHLAREGYDVFVADLRGRGGSEPHVDRHARYGQTEAICEDLPAFLDFIDGQRGDAPQHWVAHSWGGVLMNACMLRFPRHRERVRSAVYFGAKRSVRVLTWQRVVYIDLFWRGICRVARWWCGYLPARRLGIGPDDESAKSHRQSLEWVRPSPWRDTDDGFDYAAAAQTLDLPPILYLAGAADHALGHPRDVRAFMEESGSLARARYELLSKANGNARDYGHIDMLTAPEAATDHFPRVVEWMRTWADAEA